MSDKAFNAVFYFAFSGALTETDASTRLKGFLKDSGWTTEDGSCQQSLQSYSCGDDGKCEIIITGKDLNDTKENARKMFKSLTVDAYNIAWVSTLYSNETQSLVFNNMGRFLLIERISDNQLNIGDEVRIFERTK